MTVISIYCKFHVSNKINQLQFKYCLSLLRLLSDKIVYENLILRTDLIIAVGDELEFLTDGSTYRTLTLDSYNASKLSALAYDATTRRLFFSDLRHRHGHIFSVSLDEESRRPVEDIVESNFSPTV